jgi:hypothetical protein
VIVLSASSICRELSAEADDLDACGEAFGITLVSRRGETQLRNAVDRFTCMKTLQFDPGVGLDFSGARIINAVLRDALGHLDIR